MNEKKPHSDDGTNVFGYSKNIEEKIAAKTVSLLQKQMLRMYKPGEKQLRQIHPKMNGCVKATFTVEKDLPDKLRVGLFKQAATFPCWIRFSNGNTKPLPDWKKDVRGCALKLMNVPGEKIVESGDGFGNVDFILMNTKTFVASDVRNFYQVMKLLIQPPTLLSVFSKVAVAIKNSPILARGAKAKIKCNHPFELSYFSTVPFQFGDEDKAVKYALMPEPGNHLEYTDGKNNDFLRLNMQATLSKHPVDFGFYCQFQTDPHKMPIEDPTVEWTSPFVRLASVHIPVQQFDTPSQNEFGDNLSFNAWHSLPEHKPLGSFNRVRNMIYNGMSKFRHDFNQVTQPEPTADANFFNNTNLHTDEQPGYHQTNVQ